MWVNAHQQGDMQIRAHAPHLECGGALGPEGSALPGPPPTSTRCVSLWPGRLRGLTCWLSSGLLGHLSSVPEGDGGAGRLTEGPQGPSRLEPSGTLPWVLRDIRGTPVVCGDLSARVSTNEDRHLHLANAMGHLRR